jgi:hypothetical protein
MGELNFDLASEIEDNQRAEAIEKARLASKPQLPPDWDGETCYQCGNEIGSDRLAAVTPASASTVSPKEKNVSSSDSLPHSCEFCSRTRFVIKNGRKSRKCRLFGFLVSSKTVVCSNFNERKS